MPESLIRIVQCPYCKQKFGIQQGQAAEFCFLCGGRLNIQPNLKKPNVLAIWMGTLVQRVKMRFQENQRQADLERPEEPNFQESPLPFIDEDPLSTSDDFQFDPVEQTWVSPREPEELVLGDEEMEVFDPVDYLRSEMPYPEEPPADIKPEALDPIEQLRYVASSGPIYKEPEQSAEPGFSGRTRTIVLGGIAVGVVVILIILMLVKAVAG